MQRKLLFAILCIGVIGLPGAFAQTAATTAVTATCKDGSAFSGTTRSGACRGHGGVGSWGATPAAASSAAAPANAAATPPAAKAAEPATVPKTPAAPAAAGGGAGQVWVNPASKVYHCQGDRYYGKTKTGSYMTEAAAKAAGDRPSGGKACS